MIAPALGAFDRVIFLIGETNVRARRAMGNKRAQERALTPIHRSKADRRVSTLGWYQAPLPGRMNERPVTANGA
jgi:hypothetical protein